LAAWLAMSLQRRGRKVVLASRGVGGRPEQPVTVVSRGAAPLCGARVAGDEPLVLCGRAPGVPVLVARDRGLAGLRAIADFGCEILVLDDGFQHHRLHRDLDLIGFDGAIGLGNGHVLPRGPLREGVSAMEAADVVVVLDGPLASGDESRVTGRVGSAMRLCARRVPDRLVDLASDEILPDDALRGRSVGLLAGLADPGSFRDILVGLGASLCAERIFPDHHAYTRGDLVGLPADAPLWITTRKDAVKIDADWVPANAKLWVLDLNVELDDADRLLSMIEERMVASDPDTQSLN
jgi:tetraacyldisaccharide 4'-kinase